jgi:hypothetical protein
MVIAVTAERAVIAAAQQDGVVAAEYGHEQIVGDARAVDPVVAAIALYVFDARADDAEVEAGGDGALARKGEILGSGTAIDGVVVVDHEDVVAGAAVRDL